MLAVYHVRIGYTMEVDLKLHSKQASSHSRSTASLSGSCCSTDNTRSCRDLMRGGQA